MKNLRKILLVEDNPSFASAASRFFHGKNIELDIAGEYDAAISSLENPIGGKYDGLAIDCFFPKRFGSEDKSLGEIAIDKILGSEEQKRMSDYEEFLETYLDFSKPDLRKLARYLGSISKTDPQEDCIVSAIKQCSETLGKEISSHLQLQNTKTIFKKISGFQDYSVELRKALEKDESNQALGILVAEKAEKLGMNFVLATSTYHHDSLTQPIYDYCNRKRWKLIDCSHDNPDEKSEASFWNRVYEYLVR